MAGDGREMNLPERMVARRVAKLGVRYQPQQQIGPWTVDFYFRDHRLVIELDGSYHLMRPGLDARRDAWFQRRNIRTVRIPIVAVFHDMRTVMAIIRRELALAPALVGKRRKGPNHNRSGPVSMADSRSLRSHQRESNQPGGAYRGEQTNQRNENRGMTVRKT